MTSTAIEETRRPMHNFFLIFFYRFQFPGRLTEVGLLLPFKKYDNRPRANQKHYHSSRIIILLKQLISSTQKKSLHNTLQYVFFYAETRERAHKHTHTLKIHSFVRPLVDIRKLSQNKG